MGVPRMNAENFEQKARVLHGDKYDYSKVQYTEANSHVTIICPEHGEFRQTPSKHINAKRGCQACGGTKKMTLEEFIGKAEEVHGAMSKHYDYSKVKFVNTATKVEIVCNLHGSFHMTPNKHVHSKQGCQKCKSTFSLPAIAWLEYLAESRGIEIKHALRGGEERLDIDGKAYFVDGFCAESNTVYQFHGDFFHGNPALYGSDLVNKRVAKTFGELFRETKRVEDLIRSQGYHLEIIWEREWEDFCGEHGLDPKEPCQNADYECPTAEDRRKVNTERSIQKHKERLKSDPDFQAHVRARQKAYYEENKDKIQQYGKERYAKDRTKILEAQAERNASKRSEILKSRAEYRANNIDKFREREAAFRAKNKDKLREKQALYRANNKEKLRERSAAYWAKNKERIHKIREASRADNKDKICKP